MASATRLSFQAWKGGSQWRMKPVPKVRAQGHVAPRTRATRAANSASPWPIFFIRASPPVTAAGRMRPARRQEGRENPPLCREGGRPLRRAVLPRVEEDDLGLGDSSVPTQYSELLSQFEQQRALALIGGGEMLQQVENG